MVCWANTIGANTVVFRADTDVFGGNYLGANTVDFGENTVVYGAIQYNTVVFGGKCHSI